MQEDQNVEQDGAASRSPEQPEPLDELAVARKERDEYLDALQRLKAEFDNYRKRVARDQQELAARAHERLVKELVPILDDLERALAHGPAPGPAKPTPPLLIGSVKPTPTRATSTRASG